MSRVKSFVSLNYSKNFIKANQYGKVVCKMNHSELSKEKLKLKSDFNSVNLLDDGDIDDVKSKLKNWLLNGILQYSEKKSIYVYEITYKVADRSFCLRGIVAALKLPEQGENYVDSCVEFDDFAVESKKELIKETKIETEMVSVLFEDEQRKLFDLIKNLDTANCMAKVKLNEATYRVWQIVDQKTIDSLEQFFGNSHFVVVGGENQFKAAMKHRDELKKEGKLKEDDSENFVLSVFISKNEPAFSILPVHQVVSEINMFDGEKTINELKKFFNVKELSMRDRRFLTLSDGFFSIHVICSLFFSSPRKFLKI